MILCVTLAAVNSFASVRVEEKSFTGSLPLVQDGRAAAFVISQQDQQVVTIAAEAVARDIELVTGVKPQVWSSVTASLDNPMPFAVIAGTYGKNPLIQQLEKAGKLDCTRINQGQWESCVFALVEAPLPGVNRALVIAGSDRRGTAFGLFELSERCGVSPWVWWADVRPAVRTNLFIAPDAESFGPPSVRYRGIFINDEDWGLHAWAGRNADTDLKGIGPKTYARMFELLLRLKANHLWPAMHSCSRTFYSVPENKKVADDYAIVIGSSHCEPLLFNNADKNEWNSTMGDWNFVKNSTKIYELLDQRMAFAGENENVYTIALRGVHDQKMREDLPLAEKVALVEKVLQDQRNIIARHVKQPIEKIPQAFIPYNEVLEIYHQGLKVPDDVTIVWADDNLGNIRHFNTSAEQARSGGGGVYYHISYLGGIHGHFWLNSTAPAQIWKEMTRAYETGSRRIWVNNVGDLKPGEIGMEMFLQVGWDISRWNADNIGDYLKTLFTRDFGAAHAAEIADVMTRYYALTSARKPEHLGNYKIPDAGKRSGDGDFFYRWWLDGDECSRQTEAYATLAADAERLAEKLPAAQRDAYFQLVQYPVVAAANKHNHDVFMVMAQEFARQGRQSAYALVEKSTNAQAVVRAATARYNKEIAGGKWNGMMPISTSFRKVEPLKISTPISAAVDAGVQTNSSKLASTNPVAADVSPLHLKEKGDLSRLTSAATNIKASAFALAIEGARGLFTEEKFPASLRFNRYTQRKRFVDVVNLSTNKLAWRAETTEPWIKLSAERGELGSDDVRLWVEVDYAKLGASAGVGGRVAITVGGVSCFVGVVVDNAKLPVSRGDFVTEDRVVSIEANHWATNRAANGKRWAVFGGLGRKGKAVGLVPLTGWRVDDLADVKAKSPALEYTIHVPEKQTGDLQIAVKPAAPLDETKPTRCAVSIDDGAPVWVDFVMGENHGKTAAKTRNIWTRNAHSQMMYGGRKLEFPAGRHMLKIWGTDPDVILDKIVVNFGGAQESYLGSLETRVE